MLSFPPEIFSTYYKYYNSNDNCLDLEEHVFQTRNRFNFKTKGQLDGDRSDTLLIRKIRIHGCVKIGSDILSRPICVPYFSSVVFIYEDSGLVGINGLESCPSITLVDSNPLSRCDPKSPWCESKAALTSSSPSTALFQPTTPANPNRALLAAIFVSCKCTQTTNPSNLHQLLPLSFLCLKDFSREASSKTVITEASLIFGALLSRKALCLVQPVHGFFAYDELKEATNNFEPACVLGEGGFGRVFKGILGDGTAVAIKKLSSGGHQGDNEFLVEVEMLSRLHHRNLVKLLGYFNGHSPSRNLLCYELVPNGSLEAWLHGPLGSNRPLDWDTRMKIALDSARGLSYLHEDSQPSVIHRDFKASNILLENNFHAKVCSTRICMTGHLLVKSDVYSYGVVLLELLTGRRPVDMSQPSGHENLVTWARPILRDKNRLEELADPKLEGKYMMKDFSRVLHNSCSLCCAEASQRPTMGEVVLSLKMVQGLAVYQDTMPNPISSPEYNAVIRRLWF
ncbi:Receptor-like serine/threonine-protein kinase ALE2 [Platanthera guangdongensis]|uniref:Receptor-like serine/threonine-protein kinase ALE2 n=1 Tax=Platanthera guangdongensis TaxID=2320717 RepID=A0ABR2M8N1_9ASPA